MFDMTEEKSFKNASTKWLQSIMKHKDGDVEKLLVGNKLDLYQLTHNNDKHPAAEKAAKENDLEYFQTSAMTGENVNAAMDRIIERVYNKKMSQIKAGQKP